jgi:hypothetical protein
MTEYVSRAAALRRALDQLLSVQVRPFLKARGFAKSGRTFRRARDPLYDMINFQGSWWNGVAPSSTCFVNVGIGSTEIDAVYPGRSNDRKPTPEYVVDCRWERLVPGVPAELSFDETTDLESFAAGIVDGLGRVLAVIDPLDTTEFLATWAVEHNLMHRMEKTCSYLTAAGNTGLLTTYITKLRGTFHGEVTWPFLNRRLIAATGSLALQFIEQGLLDADESPNTP